MDYYSLSKEQQQFVGYALLGYSVLVDACIGSGKTTAIQTLCDLFPKDKTILYLTYNKLLKLDAKDKITGYNVDVTNYHGFAYRELVCRHVRTSMQECIRNYIQEAPPTRHYDVLVLDEYQDIDTEISEMLEHIKAVNPGIQIIAVGDMAQKIYDKTRLDAARFISGFLPAGYLKLEFTICFRLSTEHAAMLGDIWNKKIDGVNQNCSVVRMSRREAYKFLSGCQPGEILCLGANQGDRSYVQNSLEEDYPEIFNKKTVWSKINDRDGGATEPMPGVAIFTTYDGCKGMERDVCVLFDWDESYWNARIQKPGANYEIIRNIFCVAASRGKRKIVFVETNRAFLEAETLMQDPESDIKYKDMPISGMFDFKYAEDVEQAYKALKLTQIAPPGKVIEISTTDELIDLSPCVGMYQEAAYFTGYSIDAAIKQWFELHQDLDYKMVQGYEHWSVEQKVLFLTALETGQNRYYYQVAPGFVPPEKMREIAARLGTLLPPDAKVQPRCEVVFPEKGGLTKAFSAIGMADVTDATGCIYELKFVSELAYVHYLQCAMYMIAKQAPYGRLWNIRTGELWQIEIPDRKEFLSRVARAATKGRLKGYYLQDEKQAAPARQAPMRGSQRPVAAVPDVDTIVARATDKTVLKRLRKAQDEAANQSTKRVLEICMAHPETAARAIRNVLSMQTGSTPKKCAEFSWLPFEKAGIRPVFKQPSTWYKHFLVYAKIVAQTKS